mgnify:CR=1 FL=1
MSLLDSLPHTATATSRARQPKSGTDGSLGGASDSFATAVFTDRACWQQPATASEILEFDKRGVEVTNKVYFTTRPGLNATHKLEITNGDTGQTDTHEVVAEVDPDGGAGLGRLYKVMTKRTTTGSTP